MLASGNMIELITKSENSSTFVDKNDDHNLRDVLNFCSDEASNNHLLRYPNGQEEIFSFDK